MTDPVIITEKPVAGTPYSAWEVKFPCGAEYMFSDEFAAADAAFFYDLGRGLPPDYSKTFS